MHTASQKLAQFISGATASVVIISFYYTFHYDQGNTKQAT